jgi:Family of unknown function (DUF5681)
MKRRRSYEVGYGRPPVHTRFKAGQSGNPNGRPKGRKKMGDLLRDALAKRIPIREGNSLRNVSRAEAMILALITKALKGDAKACATVIALTQQSGEFERDPQPFEEVIRRIIVYPDGREEELYRTRLERSQRPGEPKRVISS